MAHFALLLTVFFVGVTPAGALADCVVPTAQYTALVQSQVAYADRYAKTNDVSKWVDGIQAEVRFWCPENKEGQLSERNLERIKKKGLLNEANWQMHAIEKAAPYRLTPEENSRLLTVLASPEVASEPVAANYKNKVQQLAAQPRQTQRSPATCSTIDDISSRLPPVRNQSLPWCGAYSAADLLSFHYAKNISAADLAIAYSSSTHASDFSKTSETQTGKIKDIIQAGLPRGLCPEAKFPSELWGDVKLVDSIKTIENFAQKTKNEKQANASFSELSCTEADAFKKIFPSARVEQLAEIAAAAGPEHIMTVIDQKQCDGDRIGQGDHLNIVTKYRRWFGFAQGDMVKDVDKQLAGHAPVGIDFSVEEIYGQRNDQRTHSAVIVGRSWNTETQSCDYLVRNSWGTSCAGYEASVKCENGNFWMPEDMLKRNMKSISYLPGDAK